MQETLPKLVTAHPRLFRGQEPAWSHVPAGWFPLVDGLCAAIEGALSEAEIRALTVHQIKSKFGGLRFYVDWSEDGLPEPEGRTPEPTVTRHPGGWLLSGQYLHPIKRAIADLIAKAGEDSYRACEWCGAPAQAMLDGGWVYTACPVHTRPGSISVAEYGRRREAKAKKKPAAKPEKERGAGDDE
jgi:hypothetical protein